MKKFAVLLLVSIMTVFFSTKKTSSCTLDKVVDGDTVKVTCGTKKVTIRLLGIDCPESSHNQKCKREGDCDDQVPRGIVAKERLRVILSNPNLSVTLVKKDRYKRDLGYVYTSDKTDSGLLLLKEGLCKNVGEKYPHPKKAEYDVVSK